jgi:hypothetical protein
MHKQQWVCMGQRTSGHDVQHARLPDGAPRHTSVTHCVPFKGRGTPLSEAEPW